MELRIHFMKFTFISRNIRLLQKFNVTKIWSHMYTVARSYVAIQLYLGAYIHCISTMGFVCFNFMN